MKKRIFKILSAGLAVALVATILVSFGQPVVQAFAHSFPHDLDDWTDHDWDKFFEYLDDEYEKEEKKRREEQRRAEEEYWRQVQAQQNLYSQYYWDGKGYNFNSNTNTGTNYTVYNTYGGGYGAAYSGINFYGGVLNVYDASTEAQAAILARIIYLYGHGVASQTAQACVGWAVMNSVDASSAGADIAAVAPNFHYNAGLPTADDYGRDLMQLSRDIIYRWKAEKNGVTNNGRVLAKEYCYVWSTGSSVTFRATPADYGYTWNYTMTTPYGS